METTGKPRAARVLLASRNAIFRESLARSLSESGDVGVVAEVSAMSEALEAAADGNVDLAVIDAALADASGSALARAVKSKCPHAKVVLLADGEDQDRFVLAVRDGVDGYVVEDRPLGQLLATIRTVLAGQCAYDPAVCARAVRRLVSGAPLVPLDAGELVVDLAGLSARERQVVELMSRGMTNKEIARELSISISTTKTHIGRVFRHLDISSRRELLPRFYRLAGWTRDT